jgi:hypothetical protein
MIDTITNWLTSLTSSTLGQFAILYVASALLSLLLGRRSQVDAWAEKHPRIAAALKLMRAVGLDPWLALQSLSLAVKGRLPKPPADQDDDDKTPPDGGKPVHVFLTLVALAFVGCSAAQEPEACSEAQLAKLEAAFLAEAVTACKLEQRGYDTCEALPVLREKYDRLRRDWISCR